MKFCPSFIDHFISHLNLLIGGMGGNDRIFGPLLCEERLKGVLKLILSSPWDFV